MKKAVTFILITLLAITFSCDDILEKDITNEFVSIISPIERAIIETNSVNFQWNTLSGADKYRVQVFNTNNTKVIDSLVTINNLTHTLLVGEYKWKVRAENFGYVSSYSELINFKVQPSTNMTNQAVVLTSPNDLAYVHARNDVILEWQQISTASFYIANLKNVSGTVIHSTPLTGMTENRLLILNSLLPEGKYAWDVKAKNTVTNTETPPTTRYFRIDKTSPNKPTNHLPVDNFEIQVNTTVSFEWKMTPDTGNEKSPISYIIEISKEIDFLPAIQTATVSTLTYSYKFTEVGTYYWRVIAIDASSNQSDYSSKSTLIIN